MRLGAEQQPRNGIRVWATVAGFHLADYCTSVSRFPGWTCVVFADLSTCAVEELSLGSLEHPFKERRLVSAGLALVDLYPCRERLECQHLIRRGAQRLRGVGRLDNRWTDAAGEYGHGAQPHDARRSRHGRAV